MLNEFEWKEKKDALIGLYESRNLLPKEEIEPLLMSMLVKKEENENLSGNISQTGSRFSLSMREKEVLKELADGKTNSQISETLSVSLSTVKKHVYSIFNKVGVNSRTQLLNLVYNM